MLKDIAFCHLQKDLVLNMAKKLMDTATKTGAEMLKKLHPKELFKKQ